MYRTLCVLALLTLQAGLAHCFSWDIVVATKNRLEFYNEEKVTYSVTFTDVRFNWITYDPFYNRVLFTNSSRSLLSFDIATRKIQNLIDLNPVLITSCMLTYDPVTGLFFVTSSGKVYLYLLKPGSIREVDANFVIASGSRCELAVDSCGGYVYWASGALTIERALLNGSKREEVISSSDQKFIYSLTIDTLTKTMYWTENDRRGQYFILSADLNGKHRRTLYHGQAYNQIKVTVSNDFIYWTELKTDDKFFWKIPKNLPIGTDVEPKKIALKDPSSTWGSYSYTYIAANYVIEEPQKTPPCKALNRMLQYYSETNDSDSLNVSVDGSLLRDNETEVTGESRVSGDTCDVSVCHNYCLQGNCSVSADGQPKCRCNAGYAGVRCEVNACQTYCFHGGVCSLSEQNNPVCQCTAGYQGERCDVPDLLIKCSQTVSLLKDILSADLSSVTEGKGVKSTCASTVV